MLGLLLGIRSVRSFILCVLLDEQGLIGDVATNVEIRKKALRRIEREKEKALKKD